MDESTSISLLQQHGIKPTSNRILVVKALAALTHPATLSDLEDQLVTVDKSGIFRSLILFREHHLVHLVEDGEGGVRYELCHSHAEDEDDDLHVHFFCECCHRVFCLHDTPIPTVQVEGGYVVHTASHMLKGICPDCAGKQPNL